jgi:flagellar basal-body rod protein FlgC
VLRHAAEDSTDIDHGFVHAMEVSASGLSAERTWMNVAASSLANAQTTQATGDGPYRRRNVVLQSVDVHG